MLLRPSNCSTIVLRLSFFVALFFFSHTACSVPAKRGVVKTLRLADGTTVKAFLRGDERAHWWQTDNGRCFLMDSLGRAVAVEPDVMVAEAKRRVKAKRATAAKFRRANMRKQNKAATVDKLLGQRHALVILVNFQDTKFKTSKYGPASQLFNRIANETNYSENGFCGSIADYFKAQSGGQFILDFDVAGPVTLSHGYAYYGANDAYGNDMRPMEMVKEACQAVDDAVDFTRYDWDGDGEVEEVFVVYAGKGEHDTEDNANLIWPHMDNLASYGEKLTLDGVDVATYACASELNADNTLSGIGTFCHEFSHCMGFPDMYDTAGEGGNYGMGSWDLMDYGSYNGDGYVPAGYSGYEKMVCGWTVPIELEDGVEIEDMSPLSSMGQTYIVYNKGNANEYYILENRQKQGFDKCLPGSGLLIEHIDYDKDIWDWNVVNTTNGEYYKENGTTMLRNDHQRVTIFHANNQDPDYDAAYPYMGLDSLTDSSRPATMLWNANTDGTYLMHCGISKIRHNGDGTMAFTFALSKGGTTGDDNSIIFKETFDKCSGKGGNDGKFNGSGIATGAFLPDNDGWKHYVPLKDNYMYGANRCARFGNTSQSYSGSVQTPAFTLTGDTLELSFRAACWNAKTDGAALNIMLDGGDAKLLDSGSLTMKKGEWTEYSLRLVGTGRCSVAFMPSKRFFLDDVVVKVKAKKATTAIGHVCRDYDVARPSDMIYTIDGKPVGSDFRHLPHGIYVVGGKKIAK